MLLRIGAVMQKRVQFLALVLVVGVSSVVEVVSAGGAPDAAAPDPTAVDVDSPSGGGDPNDSLRQQFQEFDMNKDTRIDAQELRLGLKNLDDGDLFHFYAANKAQNGKVSEDEYIDWVLAEEFAEEEAAREKEEM